MTDGDRGLAVRAGRGDRVALELLYRRHVDRVWRYGWFRTRSREAALEIVQDTFLQVMRSVRSFEGRSSFGTWLLSIARSVAVRRERASRRAEQGMRRVSALQLVPDPQAEVPADPDLPEAVRCAIAELPPAQRDAVVLFELAGLSVRESAEVLGWSESRVKVTLRRARRRLRDLLSGQLVDERAEQPSARAGRRSR